MRRPDVSRDSAPASLLAVVAATILSYAIAWIGHDRGVVPPLAVPFLNSLASFPLMVAAFRRGDLRLAVLRMLVWALTMGASATLLSYLRPQHAEATFLRAGAYRAEMFTWVMTGRGAESTPSAFIPQQARDAALFAALALATGGVLAMPMGAVLMNYMGHYVGALAASSRRPLATMLLGWHPWAVIRVVSFVVIGVVLSAPLWTWLTGSRVDKRVATRLLAAAVIGLVVDVGLKALLAPTWQRLLLRIVGW